MSVELRPKRILLVTGLVLSVALAGIFFCPANKTPTNQTREHRFRLLVLALRLYADDNGDCLPATDLLRNRVRHSWEDSLLEWARTQRLSRFGNTNLGLMLSEDDGLTSHHSYHLSSYLTGRCLSHIPNHYDTVMVWENKADVEEERWIGTVAGTVRLTKPKDTDQPLR